MRNKSFILCLIAAAFLFGGCASKCVKVQDCGSNIVVCDDPKEYKTILY